MANWLRFEKGKKNLRVRGTEMSARAIALKFHELNPDHNPEIRIRLDRNLQVVEELRKETKRTISRCLGTQEDESLLSKAFSNKVARIAGLMVSAGVGSIIEKIGWVVAGVTTTILVGIGLEGIRRAVEKKQDEREIKELDSVVDCEADAAKEATLKAMEAGPYRA